MTAPVGVASSDPRGSPRECGGTSRRPAAGARRLIGTLLVGCCIGCSIPAAAQPQKDDSIRVTPDQMHQLDVVKVEPRAFRLEKSAIGQIAYNEDVSTAVLAPFAGRVTRLIARLGERVPQGAPLLEIDSSEIVQPQNDFLTAAAAMNKARSRVALTTSV